MSLTYIMQSSLLVTSLKVAIPNAPGITLKTQILDETQDKT